MIFRPNIPIQLPNGTVTVPVGIAPSGTMGNNGALTLGTALHATYSGGIYLYFPANAISSGSAAGFYWVVMSSTTAGMVYNNTYTPGSPPARPASNTAFSTTGPGAYTGVTTEVTCSSFTLPGGMMGNFGRLQSAVAMSGPSTAGSKTFRTRMASVPYLFLAVTTFPYTYLPKLVFANRGAQGINFSSNWMGGGTQNTWPFSQTTVDTSVDCTVALTLQLGTATDYAILDFATHEVYPQ